MHPCDHAQGWVLFTVAYLSACKHAFGFFMCMFNPSGGCFEYVGLFHVMLKGVEGNDPVLFIEP